MTLRAHTGHKAAAIDRWGLRLVFFCPVLVWFLPDWIFPYSRPPQPGQGLSVLCQGQDLHCVFIIALKIEPLGQQPLPNMCSLEGKTVFRAAGGRQIT